MTVVDLHPEELLDKDARGELSDVERARLETHLARCSACRAEQLLRADFAAELGERPRDDRDSAIMGLVQGVLAAPRVSARHEPAAPREREAPPVIGEAQLPKEQPVTAPLVEPGLDPCAVPAVRRRPRRTAAVLLVAAAVLAASAAGATGLTARVWSHLRGGNQDATHASATPQPQPQPTTGPGVGAVAPAASSLAPSVADAVTPTDPAPSLEPAAAPPIAAAPLTHAPLAPLANGANGANVNAMPISFTPTPTASALFESANAARRAGDTVTALARYDALERQFPGTSEARLAKATTAKLLLDRGDASGALARFDSYLASGSPELREEAMAGRATALERLGRADDESRAWASLLATYPRTPYAAHARARVGRPLPQ